MGFRARAAALVCCSFAGLLPILLTHPQRSKQAHPQLLDSPSAWPSAGFPGSFVVLNLGVTALIQTSSNTGKVLAPHIPGLIVACASNLCLLLLNWFCFAGGGLYPRAVAFVLWTLLMVLMETQMIDSQRSSLDSVSRAGKLIEPLLLSSHSTEFLASSNAVSPAQRSLRISTSSRSLGSSSRSFSAALTPAHGPDSKQWLQQDAGHFERSGSLNSEAAAFLSLCLSEKPEDERIAAKLLRCRSRDLDLIQCLLDHGILPLLLKLCRSNDVIAAKHAQTALFNISLDQAVKPRLAEAVTFLTEAMTAGDQEEAVTTGEQQESLQLACATAYSLSVDKEMALHLHSAGAVAGLVRVMRAGGDPSNRDACKALFNITRHWDMPLIHQQTVSTLLAAGALPVIMDILQTPATPVAQKAVLILRNVVKSDEGCRALAECEDGVATLAFLLDSSPHMQETVASVLLAMAQRDPSHRELIWEEAPMMSLQMILNRGTPRGRQKAAALLDILTTKT